MRPGGLLSPLGKFGPPAVLLGLLAVVAFLRWSEPAEGMLPRCPTASLFGVFCPGCGSQRTLHALAHGRLDAAVRVNPFVVAAIPYLLFGYVVWTREVFGRPYRGPRLHPAIIWAVVAAILALTVVRNVPAWNDALGLADLSDYSAGSSTR